MKMSPVFEWTAEALEADTKLSRNEARGTLRLTLRNAGLDAKNVRQAQMEVVVGRLLPAALRKVRVEHADEACKAIMERLKHATVDAAKGNAPEDIFSRLAF